MSHKELLSRFFIKKLQQLNIPKNSSIVDVGSALDLVYIIKLNNVSDVWCVTCDKSMEEKKMQKVSAYQSWNRPARRRPPLAAADFGGGRRKKKWRRPPSGGGRRWRRPFLAAAAKIGGRFGRRAAGGQFFSIIFFLSLINFFKQK